MEQALAPNTRKTYYTNFQKCRQFIETILNQRAIMPFTTEQLHLYVAYMHSQHLKHTTIVSHLSAIAHYHKMQQLQDPTTAYPTIKLLAGVRNSQSSPPDQRLPITRSVLLALVTVLPACTTSNYEARLYKSMYTLMYYACLRASEALHTETPQHNLTISNLTLFPAADHFNITFNSFKHSLNNNPIITVSSTHAPDCPVQALQDYLPLRGSLPGPLFIKNSQPILRNSFTSTLKACLKYINLPNTNYNIHSFRIGRTTDMAQQNISHGAIQQIGRWKSNAFLKYVRPHSILAQPSAAGTH